MDDDLEFFADGRLDEPAPVVIPTSGYYCERHGFVRDGGLHWCGPRIAFRFVLAERPEGHAHG